MHTVILLVMILAAFIAQCLIDAKNIREFARGRGWSNLSISFAPFAPKSFRDSRGVRSYSVRFRDERGASAEGYCYATSLFMGSADDVLFDGKIRRFEGARNFFRNLGRPGWIILGGGAGAWLATMIGIGVCLIIFPGSNIAPAYGVIFGGPIGLIAGVAFGALKRI